MKMLLSRSTFLFCRVIVIHGAGSYGHLKAKRWKLNEGKILEQFHVNDPNGLKRYIPITRYNFLIRFLL